MIPGTQTLTMNDQVTIGFAVSVNTLLITLYLAPAVLIPQTSATHYPPFGNVHSLPREIRLIGTILVFSDLHRKNDLYIHVRSLSGARMG